MMKDLTIPATGKPAPRSAGKMAVVEGLIADLITGKYQGGDRLTEAAAVEQFGFSRTPVREALVELEGLGLLERRPNCGAVFLPFGPTELEEIYAVRTLLEVEATRLATGNIDTSLIASLVSGFEKIRDENLSDSDWSLDRSLHAAIATAAGNRRLSTEIERYNGLVQTIRKIVGAHALGIHRTSADEHLAILNALENHDAAKAADAMKNHLEQASRSAVDATRELR